MSELKETKKKEVVAKQFVNIIGFESINVDPLGELLDCRGVSFHNIINFHHQALG